MSCRLQKQIYFSFYESFCLTALYPIRTFYFPGAVQTCLHRVLQTRRGSRVPPEVEISCLFYLLSHLFREIPMLEVENAQENETLLYNILTDTVL